jgi:YHS domain-containing protein
MLRILLLGLLLILIARAFWRVVDGIISGASGQPGARSQGRPVKLIRDPVCGTFVAPSTARSLTSGGQTHYFCSEECRVKFQS